MFGMSIITQGLVLLETMILTKAGQRIVYSLRMEVFSHIESMSQIFISLVCWANSNCSSYIYHLTTLFVTRIEKNVSSISTTLNIDDTPST